MLRQLWGVTPLNEAHGMMGAFVTAREWTRCFATYLLEMLCDCIPDGNPWNLLGHTSVAGMFFGMHHVWLPTACHALEVACPTRGSDVTFVPHWGLNQISMSCACSVLPIC